MAWSEGVAKASQHARGRDCRSHVHAIGNGWSEFMLLRWLAFGLTEVRWKFRVFDVACYACAWFVMADVDHMNG